MPTVHLDGQEVFSFMNVSGDFKLGRCFGRFRHAHFPPVHVHLCVTCNGTEMQHNIFPFPAGRYDKSLTVSSDGNVNVYIRGIGRPLVIYIGVYGNTEPFKFPIRGNFQIRP